MPGLVLIGFKSCGKTTVGLLVAEYLQVPFTDLDDLVEARYRQTQQQARSCREIYQAHGEGWFRALESRVLADVAAVGDVVLATGGGAPLAAQNQAHLREIGMIVYLKASPATLWPRYEQEGMPAFLRGLHQTVVQQQATNITSIANTSLASMSPEQLAGDAPSVASDLYAAALLILYCLTGLHRAGGPGAAGRRSAG